VPIERLGASMGNSDRMRARIPERDFEAPAALACRLQTLSEGTGCCSVDIHRFFFCHELRWNGQWPLNGTNACSCSSGNTGRYFTAIAKMKKPNAMIESVIEYSVHFGMYFCPADAFDASDG
jgi:hypothetical protein